MILSADEQTTNLQYTLDDGTDQIVVKMWVDQEQDDAFAERRAQWKEGAIVRVIGNMRAFNNMKSVVAYSIQPITDYNEYTFHFLEVIHTHLRFTKGAPPQAAPTGYGGAALGGAAGASYGAIPGNGGAAAAQQGGQMYGQAQQRGLARVARALLLPDEGRGERERLHGRRRGAGARQQWRDGRPGAPVR